MEAKKTSKKTKKLIKKEIKKAVKKIAKESKVVNPRLDNGCVVMDPVLNDYTDNGHTYVEQKSSNVKVDSAGTVTIEQVQDGIAPPDNVNPQIKITNDSGTITVTPPKDD